MLSRFRSKILAFILALPVAGFALWWYGHPLPLFGVLMALISGSFTFLIIDARRKMSLQRSLFIGLFVVFLGTILSVVYVDNTLAAFLDWASRHTIAYYRVGETVRSTVFPCALTLPQVFLGLAAVYFPSTGSWLVSFPSSLHAFLLILIPFTATTLLFGRSICGWICPFGGLPEAMVTGNKSRWSLNFLKKK